MWGKRDGVWGFSGENAPGEKVKYEGEYIYISDSDRDSGGLRPPLLAPASHVTLARAAVPVRKLRLAQSL